MNKLFIRVVNRYCTFKFLLSYIDTDINEIGKCFCPFHENTDTPAAKIYKNDDGESLYCFAESHMYRPADLLIRDIVPFTVDHVGGLIWEKLSESERSLFNTDGVKIISRYDKSVFDLFKSGSISYKELIERIESSQ